MTDDWDVVVIGAGGAGLAAAVAAADAGARVLVFESEDAVGGSTMLSAGMFTAAGTSVQASLGISDSPAAHFQHTMDLNQWRLRPGLLRSFCERSRDTFEWLLQLGLEVPAQRSTNAHMPGLTRAGVEDVWRGHVPAGEGYGLVEVLDRARRQRGVELVLRTRVERLLVTDGRVRGVVADGIEVPAAATVVASGGLTRSPELLERFYPDALRAGEHLFVVSAPGSRGDHIGFGEQVDAAVAGSGWGMLLVTAYFQRLHHWQSGFPPAARILVDDRGRRFMDEDASYAVAAGIVDDHGGRAWMIFDEAGRLSLAPGYPHWSAEHVLAEAAAGRTHRADTVADLARAIGADPDVLITTLERWNETLPHGQDPEFLRHETLAAKGARPPAPIVTAPYYAVRVLPAELAVSHAGLLIDESARVLDGAGRVIPGLFAAGEASGGILGNRYVGGGTAVANAVVNGRSAGAAAMSRTPSAV
ncbi:FAD-dependent oxidoreductase [Nakamurella leprariae]|uniref:FAD-dependent oxidoreductase n=1 Tax=Nakamurella leprariae TaxID=2803911 RepID=A0A938YFU2_9ACTN|nr:FAD-dependent oxidoreductase [Nakamurella leprariae]MBM9468756.1 FAD-dependent oxidoreductase [Nakamurella leprariae]